MKKSLRILLVSRCLPFGGGRQVFVDSLVKELARHHSVYVITPDDYKSEYATVFRYENNYDYLKDVFSRIKPDVVNSHTFYLSEIVMGICKEKKIPFAITVHGDQFIIGDPQSQKLMRSTVEYSDRVIAVCGVGLVSLLKNTRIESDQVLVIENGIDIARFKSSILRHITSVVKLRLLHPRSMRILVPARIVWYKGTEFAIDSIISNTSLQRHRFLFAYPEGSLDEGDLFYARVAHKVMDSGLTGCIKFLSADYKLMPKLYSDTDVVLLPSSSEQYPLVLLESIASLKPFAATETGGVPDINRNFRQDNLFEYGNMDQLASSLDSLKRGNGLISLVRMILMRRKLDIRICANKYVKLYLELIVDV